MENMIVLIPAYNPTDNFISLIKELNENKIKVIVVNDGSNELSNEVFNSIKNNCILLNHKVNKGKGCALKTGFKYIKDNYKDVVVVTMDADLQHTVKDAIRVYECVLNNKDSLVLGCRKPSKDTPLRSKFGNGITKFIFHLVTGVKINDTQTGLRGFYIDMIDEMINIKGDRYEYEMNVLLTLAKKRTSIKEITIKTIYIDNNSSSHFKAIRDSFRIYKEIIKFSFVSILSFIIDYVLYCLFLIIFKSHTLCIQISNVIARLFSATFNYNMNKNYVFSYKKKSIKTLIQYIILAIVIIGLNTIILKLFISKLSINKYLAKIITELILFIGSFIIQQKLIFKKYKI